MERAQAEQKLNQIFHLERFYEDQWQTIHRLLRGERLLLIQRTGFGKSLCFQYPATQLYGLAVIFSPLIALMRNQVKYLKSICIKAECINSEQDDFQNSEILEQAKSRKQLAETLNERFIVLDGAKSYSEMGNRKNKSLNY